MRAGWSEHEGRDECPIETTWNPHGRTGACQYQRRREGKASQEGLQGIPEEVAHATGDMEEKIEAA